MFSEIEEKSETGGHARLCLPEGHNFSRFGKILH